MNRRRHCPSKIKPGWARLTAYASRSNKGAVHVTEFDWATEAMVKPGRYYRLDVPLDVLRDAPILDISSDDPADRVSGSWVGNQGHRRPACFRRVP